MRTIVIIAIHSTSYIISTSLTRIKHSINIFCYNYTFNCVESPVIHMIHTPEQRGRRGYWSTSYKLGFFLGCKPSESIPMSCDARASDNVMWSSWTAHAEIKHLVHPRGSFWVMDSWLKMRIETLVIFIPHQKYWQSTFHRLFVKNPHLFAGASEKGSWL